MGATLVGVSITQARRIHAAGSEFQPVGKDDLKAADFRRDINDLLYQTR